MTKTLLLLPLLAALCMAGGAARADGLSDLKAALEHGSKATPVKGRIEARVVRRLGEGASAVETTGRANIQVSDGAGGLALSYGEGLLAQVRAEQSARAKDPDIKTPTLHTLGELGTGEVLSLLSAAPRILRSLEKAHFKSERAATHNGKPARLLSFDIPIETLSKRDRKYAKRLDSVYEIWIGPDGTPLASRKRQTVWGRAFVVITFEATTEEYSTYGLVDGRLVALRIDSHDKAEGMGERDETKSVKTLQVQS
ncbi:hypothetical protein [Massilia glaciei]|uniref:Uncharacterized protein n=1 Tax=Massilia glaciei TaxID=1524097 RepID=A0A2U2HHD2_9BURK|nr:hypothetical protein [Massilia glaciei]PWF45063.1 hypothetical protein C7C56_018245 [Massilia glaciei]